MILFLKNLSELLSLYSPQKSEPLIVNLKSHTNEIKQISTVFFDLYSTLPNLKDKYKNDCKLAEEYIIDFESNKFKLLLDEKVEYKTNIKTKLQLAKESENEYYNIVESINVEHNKFYSRGSAILTKLKNIEIEVNLMFQHSLQKFQAYLINKNEEEIKEYTKESEAINYLIFSSFEEDGKNDLFSYKFCKPIKFEPYELKTLKPDSNKIGKKNIKERININISNYNVISKMKRELKGIAQQYDLEKEATKIEISKLCKTILQKPLNENDNNKLLQHCKTQEYRLHFFVFLNNARVAGKFFIKKYCFIQLGHLMYNILDLIITANDLECMKYLLIISQTYYFINSKKEKIYLVRFIEDHEIFQSMVFWESYFKDSITQDLNKQNKNDNSEMKNEEKIVINVVYTKLLSIGHTMTLFQIDKTQIKSLITIFTKQYQINEQLEIQVTTMIDESVYHEKKKFNEEEDLTEKTTDENVNNDNNVITDSNIIEIPNNEDK